VTFQMGVKLGNKDHYSYIEYFIIII